MSTTTSDSCRKTLLQLYEGRCAFHVRCGSPGPMTIDHIHPRKLNGANKIWNKRPLCARCHFELNKRRDRFHVACRHEFVKTRCVAYRTISMISNRVCISCGGYENEQSNQTPLD